MTRRSGLGRGLDALLPTDDDGLERKSGLFEVNVEAIAPNPRQPRGSFDEAGLTELADSITQLGVLQPLLVREPDPGRYELIAGERRLRAAKLAGLTHVPVVITETDDRGALERALVENIHRTDLNPIEEAAAYRQLISDAGLTQEQLAERLGRNRVSITNALRLLDLPPQVQRLLVERRLSAGHGRALLGLERSPFLERAARRAADEKLSVRETEALVRRYEQMTATAPGRAGAGGGERPALVAEAQRRLADHLQTRVRVELGKRKGKITLDFASLDELERLLEVILEHERGEAPAPPGD